MPRSSSRAPYPLAPTLTWRAPIIALTSLILSWWVGLAGCAVTGEPADPPAPPSAAVAAPARASAPAPAQLTAIVVDQARPRAALGRIARLTATGRFSDGTTRDLTGEVTWESQDAAVATISNASASRGLAATRKVGTARVTATMGEIRGEVELGVTPATLVSLAIDPTNPSVASGGIQQLTATGTFSDATTQNLTDEVTWLSSNPEVAQVSNACGSRGQATAIAAGTATVTASLGAIQGATVLTVSPAVLTSITISPPSAEVRLGAGPPPIVPWRALGLFSDQTTQDLTEQVTWSSSNLAVAAISNADGARGVASGVGLGGSTISATLSGVTGTAIMTVVPARLLEIQITPSNPSIANGSTLALGATGRFDDGRTQDLTTQVSWGSDNELIAKVSNAAAARGRATALGVGDVTVTAGFGGVLGSTTLHVTAAVLRQITITPPDLTVASGHPARFIALGTFTDQSQQDVTTQVTWASSALAVAAVSNAEGSRGTATTLAAGTARITATLGGVVGATTLTVTDSVIEAIDVVPVGLSATPNGFAVALGLVPQFIANCRFSDGITLDLTDRATWSSSAPAVARVSDFPGSRGAVFTNAVGVTTIQATLDGVIGAATLNVTDAEILTITVTPGGTTLTSGASIPYTATAELSIGITMDVTTAVTWTSLDPAVAQVSNATGSQGRVAALAPGVTVITATLGDRTGAATLTVVPVDTCAARLVISQVYGAGGNAGSSFRNDYVELHNVGTGPADLAGLAIQYASAAGNSWQVTPLPAVVVPAGGYFLIQEAQGTTQSAVLPTPDLVAAPPIAMGGAAGKIALTSSTTPLTGACPLGSVLDLVGYGTAACFEGTGPTAAPGATLSVQRNGAGCSDTNDNAADFGVATPAPRSAASPAAVCACTR